MSRVRWKWEFIWTTKVASDLSLEYWNKSLGILLHWRRYFDTPSDAVSRLARQPKKVSLRSPAEDSSSRILLRGARGSRQVHSWLLSRKAWTFSVKLWHLRGGNFYVVLVWCATGSCEKTSTANLETEYWFSPRRGKIKHMKRIRPASAMRSAQKTSFRKIVEEQARRKLSEVLKSEKDGIGNQPVRL